MSGIAGGGGRPEQRRPAHRIWTAHTVPGSSPMLPAPPVIVLQQRSHLQQQFGLQVRPGRRSLAARRHAWLIWAAGTCSFSLRAKIALQPSMTTTAAAHAGMACVWSPQLLTLSNLNHRSHTLGLHMDD